MERWKGGEVARWRDGEMEGWKGGEVARWRDGEMEGWKGEKVKHVDRFPYMFLH